MRHTEGASGTDTVTLSQLPRYQRSVLSPVISIRFYHKHVYSGFQWEFKSNRRATQPLGHPRGQIYASSSKAYCHQKLCKAWANMLASVSESTEMASAQKLVRTAQWPFWLLVDLEVT